MPAERCAAASGRSCGSSKAWPPRAWSPPCWRARKKAGWGSKTIPLNFQLLENIEHGEPAAPQRSGARAELRGRVGPADDLRRHPEASFELISARQPLNSFDSQLPVNIDHGKVSGPR